jgi:hypothetical protein
MNTEQIRLRLTNGFRPFAICLSDGRRFEVPHPEFILVGRHVVAILDQKDIVRTIDALHIVSVEDIKVPAKSRRG